TAPATLRPMARAAARDSCGIAAPARRKRSTDAVARDRAAAAGAPARTQLLPPCCVRRRRKVAPGRTRSPWPELPPAAPCARRALPRGALHAPAVAPRCSPSALVPRRPRRAETRTGADLRPIRFRETTPPPEPVAAAGSREAASSRETVERASRPAHP